MFILCEDCKQESESENTVKWVFLEILIYSKASSIALASGVNIVASSGSRTENMSLLTTAAAATLFLSFEPSVYISIVGCFECLNSANFCLNTRRDVSFFLNSDKEVSTSGFD